MKKTHLIAAVVIAGLSLFSVGALAAELHPVLKQLKDEKNAKIEFLGHDSGLDGWLVTAKNDAGGDVVQYAYTNKQGALVIGILFGPDGNATTVNQLASYRDKIKGGKDGAEKPGGGEAAKAGSVKTELPAVPEADMTKEEPEFFDEPPLPNLPDVSDETVAEAVMAPAGKVSTGGGSKAENFYALTEKANWVHVGSKDAPYMYVFMNVTCDHCVAYWKSLSGSVAAGMVALRLVPFGAIEQNRKLGAALLGSPDPAKAWRDYVDGKLSAMPLSLATPATLKKIDANTELWGKMGIGSEPPFSLYRALSDGKIRAVLGKPDNAMMLIADMME